MFPIMDPCAPLTTLSRRDSSGIMLMLCLLETFLFMECTESMKSLLMHHILRPGLFAMYSMNRFFAILKAMPLLMHSAFVTHWLFPSSSSKAFMSPMIEPMPNLSFRVFSTSTVTRIVAERLMMQYSAGSPMSQRVSPWLNSNRSAMDIKLVFCTDVRSLNMVLQSKVSKKPRACMSSIFVIFSEASGISSSIWCRSCPLMLMASTSVSAEMSTLLRCPGSKQHSPK